MVGLTATDGSGERFDADHTLELELRSSVDAPGMARRAVTRLVTDHPRACSQLDQLNLLVSELVTNAVIHTDRAPADAIALKALVTPTLTRVTVTDGGGGFPPSVGRFARDGGGYGLKLLDAEASRWGTSKAPAGFSVWFELDHPL
jgi:anti-sigma regulatory factor (Ser/Thr protein kinase)